MKAFKAITAIAVVLIFAFGSTVFAAGPGGGGKGKGDGKGHGKRPMVDILSGTPFTLTGTVVSIGDRRSGMELDDGTEPHTIYGIGPDWYWVSVGMARPAAGDEIIVNGYDVEFSDGLTRAIAMSVTVAGNEVVLRDAETGEPVWRTMERPNPFTEGEAVVIEGNVSNVTDGRHGGIDVDTGSETITIIGIGPARYWESLGVDLPEVGDAIVVNGVVITLSDGTEKVVASSIVIDGQTVELHDPETGKPLFKKGKKGKKGRRPRPGDDTSGQEPVQP